MSQTARSWLSRQAQELVVRCENSKLKPFDCDLLIVGSGYGGAVAAARAAAHEIREPDGRMRPARVWVLERGNEYLPGMFPSRFSELAGHVRFDVQDGRPARGVSAGLFDARLGPDVCVLLGNGLGGGSLINAGVMAVPDDNVFSSHWPSAITRKSLDAGYAAAQLMLSPEPVPAGKECDKLRSFINVAAPQKVDAAPITVHWKTGPNHAGVQMQACTLCGDCMTGCNQSAKGSVDTNYLAWAGARGVEFFCGGTVRTLARDATDSFWEVRWDYTERALRPQDGKPFVVRAKRVVLAAGSLGSTEILLRSEGGSLNFSERLGDGFSFNGGKIAAGARHQHQVHSVGEEETDPGDATNPRWIGPTITGMVRVGSETDANGDTAPGFVIEEFAVPAGLRHVFAEIVALLATLNGAPIGGKDRYAIADDDIDRISLYGLTGDDGAVGCLRLPEPPPNGADGEGLRIAWDKARELPLFERMAAWLDEHLKPAVQVPNQSVSGLFPAITVHPLGGCRMGDDFASGVVDHRGCVFVEGAPARDDLVVLDGSIVPRALGINPALTIAALAEHAMPLLLKAWDWKEVSEAPVVTPRPQGRRRELPARDVVWSIRERLQGLFSIDGQTFWARMEIEFEDIPGFRRALELRSRAVAVRRSTLELFRANPGDDMFTVDEPQGAPLCLAGLSGSVALFVPLTGAKPDDERVMLSYRLSVQSVQGNTTPLKVGDRLDGVKVFGTEPTGDADGEQSEDGRVTSPLRQLTEMDIRCNGIPAGHWVLDMEDLAQRRDPLVRIVQLSSMPDALDDLAAIALYVLRRTLRGVLLAISFKPAKADHLCQRWPGAVRGINAEITPLSGGARLARYSAPSKQEDGDALPPVLLIHGLAYSGSSYTDESLPDGLAATLLDLGREVWVLDVRSSIGNENARHERDHHGHLKALTWTVDGVASDDLPQAINFVFKECRNRPVDVFAHCMGAVMFCLAALGDDRIKGQVRAVVLSQVGPLIRFSPSNRLRGYLASYLQQFLGVGTLDTCPAFESRKNPDGSFTWLPPKQPEDMKLQLFVDALLTMFPYPDDDDEAKRAGSGKLKGSDFRRIRHRGDAIFGQLFELENVSDDSLARLEVFMGWVMVPMLAQAIHFARRNMLTNASGFNAVLNAANFKERFNFPLLIIHGRRNRLFNWRGSLDSWKLLNDLRGDLSPSPKELKDGKGEIYGSIYGPGTATQLAVFDRYGHMDCIIGELAHQDIFGVVSDFFAGADGHRQIGAAPPPTQFETPWIGPVLGWVRPLQDNLGQKWLRVRLQVHPQRSRSKTEGIAIVPMRSAAGIPVPDVSDARVVKWPADSDRHATLDLDFSPAFVRRCDTFALLTMHIDLPLRIIAKIRIENWLEQGRELGDKEEIALQSWLATASNAAALAGSTFSLAPKVVRAADGGTTDGPPSNICLALTSCQYPPGLFDERPAGASYERLQSDAMAPDGPQFLVLCGDQVYVDATAGVFDPVVSAPQGGDLQDSALDRTYELNWRLQPFRRTTARLPVFAMLDDHEVRDNWKGRKNEPGPPGGSVERALDAFDRYQGRLNPDRPLCAKGASASRSFIAYPGGVPLIVLDTRSARSPRVAGNVEGAKIIPDEEMEILKEALCEAPELSVKFIVSPAPILPPDRFDPRYPAERLRSDSWSGYPASVAALLEFIRDNKKIRRVVFLSGDAHLSSVCSFTFGTDVDIRVVSVVSSGMYTPWPFANHRPDELSLTDEIDLGLTGSLWKGTLRLHAMSTNNGYAVVSTRHVDDEAWLAVSLRSANGATTDCQIQLA